MAPRRTHIAGVRALAGEAPVAVTVRGGLMAPLLGDGDRVEVAPARFCRATWWPSRRPTAG